MTTTPTEERETVTEASEAGPAPESEPVPFWQRPYVERFLVPLVLPIAVIIGLVAYVLNISRIFLSGHGHIPVMVGSAITLMILVGAAMLSAASPRLRQSAITLTSVGFILLIMSSGWLVLGHSQPEKTGPAVLPASLKVAQPVIKLVAGAGGNLKFTPNQFKATTGLARIQVTFSGSHTFNMRDSETLFAPLTANGDGVAFFAHPGKYQFFCAIPGHDGQGMNGVIDVTGTPMTLTEALTKSGNAPSAAG